MLGTIHKDWVKDNTSKKAKIFQTKTAFICSQGKVIGERLLHGKRH
jgi:hypothetical protein